MLCFRCQNLHGRMFVSARRHPMSAVAVLMEEQFVLATLTRSFFYCLASILARVLQCSRMQVLLLKDVKGLGRKGEKKEVSDGHARNFLIPNGFVAAATAQTLAVEERKEKANEVRERREKKEAQRLQGVLQGKTVVIHARVSDAGNLYAAVGPAQVVEALKKMDATVDPSLVRMQPIKHPGTTEAMLALHPSVSAKIYIQVVTP